MDDIYINNIYYNYYYVAIAICIYTNCKMLFVIVIIDVAGGDNGSVPYFDLTTYPGVKELPTDSLESTSDPINIPLGLLFGLDVHHTVYVRYNLITLNLYICIQLMLYTYILGALSKDLPRYVH